MHFTTEKVIRNKGKNILGFPMSFVVVDIETTGLDPKYDEIIEIAAIKVENGIVIDHFSTLIKPLYEIDEYITELTGITNDLLKDAPVIKDVISDIYNFIGKNILLGHNVNFDINFLYDELLDHQDIELNNDFVDTMKIGRYLLKDLKHHRLIDIAENYGILTSGNHRSLRDCEITLNIYKNMFNKVIVKYETEEMFLKSIKRIPSTLNINEIKTIKTEFDISHQIYNKHCVFTGSLTKMERKDAMQKVVDLGGYCSNSITKKTNYLILGNNDYNPLVKDGKSNKQKKAEQMKLSGNDIEIISENIFYEMIEIDL